MNTTSVNFKNSKTYDPHTLLLNLTDKMVLKRKDKYTALSILSIYYTWKNIRKSYKNNNFKTLVPAWNEDGSYSMSDIQDYFEYVLKSMGKRQLILP